ncbi:hypothetical protein, partial [Gossypium barbadense]
AISPFPSPLFHRSKSQTPCPPPIFPLPPIKVPIHLHRSKSRSEVRGKMVYLQYSNRQEIVNNKTTADIAGNVLLVTIGGQDAWLVSIDVLHLVFSAFGFVHKITTFEKTAGFQSGIYILNGN